ncbi:MAG TPA: TonB family protein [Vicinamibacteria bacterium]|nr:TonB family protein [Vicinamibacteria bacterium]
MNDPVDGVLAERAALERGFTESLLLSGFAHALLIGMALFAAWLSGRQPPIRIATGFAVSLPPGGGTPEAAPAPPAPAPPAPVVTQPPAVKPEPPPKIIKPPQETVRKGLPDPDAKRSNKKEPERPASASAGAAGTARNTAATQGFSLTAPPGAGVPGGTDPFGDWYLAAVQRKIWMLWAQQIRNGMTQPAIVSFTILANGSVADVQLAQSSGVYLLDSAAQRAILSAAPFGPLPKDYGTNRITIQGIFKPGE